MSKPGLILIGAGGHARACIDVIEQHVRPTDPHSMSGYGSQDLIPYVPRSFNATMTSLPKIPSGYYGLGELTFKPQGSETGVVFEFEVEP